MKEEPTKTQVIALLLKELNIGELRAIENLCMNMRLRLQEFEDSNIRNI